MKFRILLIGLALTSAVAVGQPTLPSASVSKHIAKILSRGDGTSDQSAYKVKSVREEYQILAALGLTAGKQSLVIRKKPYDVIEASDPRTGATREVWFDIGSFYPEIAI